MRKGERRDEAREEEAENDKDDSETDHDVCLVSADVGEEDGRVSIRRLASHRQIDGSSVAPPRVSATSCPGRN